MFIGINQVVNFFPLLMFEKVFIELSGLGFQKRGGDGIRSFKPTSGLTSVEETRNYPLREGIPRAFAPNWEPH